MKSYKDPKGLPLVLTPVDRTLDTFRVGECLDFEPDIEAQCDCLNCGRPYEQHKPLNKELEVG